MSEIRVVKDCDEYFWNKYRPEEFFDMSYYAKKVLLAVAMNGYDASFTDIMTDGSFDNMEQLEEGLDELMDTIDFFKIEGGDKSDD